MGSLKARSFLLFDNRIALKATRAGFIPDPARVGNFPERTRRLNGLAAVCKAVALLRALGVRVSPGASHGRLGTGTPRSLENCRGLKTPVSSTLTPSAYTGARSSDGPERKPPKLEAARSNRAGPFFPEFSVQFYAGVAQMGRRLS